MTFLESLLSLVLQLLCSTTDIQDENTRADCSYKNVDGVDTHYFRNPRARSHVERL